MKAQACKQEYEFTLALNDSAPLTSADEDALFSAGCDDATIAIRSGRVFVTFARQDTSLKSAILSAINDIRRASIGREVLRVDYCNLITQAEIARRIGRSRQQVHQYITGVRGPGGFPGPVCGVGEGTDLWMWCEVARWLREHDMIEADAVREAEEVEAINAVLELAHHVKRNSALTEEIQKSITRV